MNETLKIKKGYWQNLTVAKRRACVQSVLSPFKDGRLFKAEEVTKEIKHTYKDHYYFTRGMTIGVGHMLAGLGFVKGIIPVGRCCLWKWGKPREKSADMGQEANDSLSAAVEKALDLIEAAKLMNVSTQTVRRLIQREILTAQKSVGPHGLRWEIDRAELLRYLEATRGGQQPISTAGPKFADAHDKPKPTLADAYDKPAPTPTVITMETPGGAKTPAEMALFRLEDYLMDKAQEARIHQNEKDEMENYYKGRKVMAKEAATMLRHFRRLELKLAEGGNHS